jgi:hypothetical protein
MKFRGWRLALLLTGATAAAATAQTGLGTPAGEQYVPQLGDIMNSAQVRHHKLYVAGKARNWELAAYESRQLRGNLRDAALLYSGIPVSSVTTLAERLQSLDDAIEAKDGSRFTKTFGELTGGCNECHQSLGRAFIVIKQPSDQPFGNQQFAPRGEH